MLLLRTAIIASLLSSAAMAAAQTNPEPPRAGAGADGAGGGVSLLACGGGVPPAEVRDPPPPEKRKFAVSPGGVDMRSGNFNFENGDVSIGGEGDAGLSLVRSFSFNDGLGAFRQAFGKFFTHNWDIQLRENRTAGVGSCNPGDYDYNIQIIYGGLGEGFFSRHTPLDFKQTAPAGYAELVGTGTGSNPTQFTFTARDGTIVEFLPIPSGYFGSACPGTTTRRCTMASKITRPDGTVYTLEYEALSGTAKRLRSVTSNRGYALLFEYATSSGGFELVDKVCAINLAETPKPATNICPAGVRTANYTYSGFVQTTAQEAGSGTWNFATPTGSSFSIRRPGEATPYVVNTYGTVSGSYDNEVTMSIASQNFAAGLSYTYTWDYITNVSGDGNTSTQVAGGKWTDSNGKSVIVKYGTYRKNEPNYPYYSATLYPTPGPESVTDENGFVTKFNYCGTIANGAICDPMPPLQYAEEPEGNREAFQYTSYRNVAVVTKKAKPGSALADIVEERTYGSTNPTSRAKPTVVTDPRDKPTTYTYDPVHGGVLTETSPGVLVGAAGAWRAMIKRYSYVQRYAWIRNAAGTGYVQAATPVWLLNDEKYCRSSAPSGAGCAAANDLVTTTYDYGPNSGPNNLLLRGKTVTTAGVTQRTCYGYDSHGNRISETLPRAGLSSCP